MATQVVVGSWERFSRILACFPRWQGRVRRLQASRYAQPTGRFLFPADCRVFLQSPEPQLHQAAQSCSGLLPWSARRRACKGTNQATVCGGAELWGLAIKQQARLERHREAQRNQAKEGLLSRSKKDFPSAVSSHSGEYHAFFRTSEPAACWSGSGHATRN